LDYQEKNLGNTGAVHPGNNQRRVQETQIHQLKVCAQRPSPQILRTKVPYWTVEDEKGNRQSFVFPCLHKRRNPKSLIGVALAKKTS